MRSMELVDFRGLKAAAQACLEELELKGVLPPRLAKLKSFANEFLSRTIPKDRAKLKTQEGDLQSLKEGAITGVACFYAAVLFSVWSEMSPGAGARKLSDIARRAQRALVELKEISRLLNEIDLSGLYLESGYVDFDSFALAELNLTSRALKGLKDLHREFSIAPGDMKGAGEALEKLLWALKHLREAERRAA